MVIASLVFCLKISIFARFCVKYTIDTDEKFEKTVFDGPSVRFQYGSLARPDHGEGQRCGYLCG